MFQRILSELIMVENIEVERQCLFMFNFDEIDSVIFAILIREGPLWADW